MVWCEHLQRRFGSFVAVKDLNLDIRQGEIFGFLGPNGAGKTTAIRMLCGLLQPSGGTGSVAGYDIFTQREQIKRQLGYMSQRFALYEDLSVRESVEFYGGIYGLDTALAVQRAINVLTEFGLDPNLKLLIKSLPVGYRQRLALACSLLHDPPLLVLDEPTSGVDPQARRAFWKVINRLADQGKTIIVTTHFMDEAEYCHRLLIMNFGVVVAQGRPSELKTAHRSQNMQQLFLQLVSGD